MSRTGVGAEQPQLDRNQQSRVALRGAVLFGRKAEEDVEHVVVGASKTGVRRARVSASSHPLSRGPSRFPLLNLMGRTQ